MATLYFHIGTPKTGTTHIQNFMWNNGEALKKQGYVYPHFAQFPGIGKARNGYFLKTNFEGYQKNFGKIGKLASQYENIILSDEGMWNMNKSYMERFYENTKEYGLDVKIIVYLRRQDLYLQSNWAQKVKEDSQDTFQEYIEKGVYKAVRFDYFDRLNEIAQIVGKENIIVRVYEKSQFKNHNLTDDFLETVGLELTPDFIMPERVFNMSLGGPYLEVKRYLNSNKEFAALDNYAYPLIKKVMEQNHAKADFSSSRYLSADEQWEFMAQYQDTNEKVAREYLGRENGKLFYEEEVQDGEEPVAFSTQELIDICGQMLQIQHTNYTEQIKQCKETIKEQEAVIKKQQSTIDWVTTSFPKKVVRKLKRMAGIK